MRSIIQVAGRVQRHRQQVPITSNQLVLNNNIRALKNETPAYCKPGFESKALPLASHDLNDLVSKELIHISAVSRIIEPTFTLSDFEVQEKYGPANSVNGFIVQEHRAMRFHLEAMNGVKFNKKFYRNYKEANVWWDETSGEHASWNAEFIRQTEFRKSQMQEAFVLRCNEDDELTWSQLDTTSKPYTYTPKDTRFNTEDIQLAQGCYWWFAATTQDIYQYFADALNCNVQKASEQLGEINLRAENNDKEITWTWHQQLGVYEQLKSKENQWN